MLNKISKDLDFLKKEVLEIKKHMVDADCIMTSEDFEALATAREEKKLGKLTSLEDIKKELKL